MPALFYTQPLAGRLHTFAQPAMDSLTHIALGACIGEALLGKKLGKRAMLLGAIAQSVPDIDFLANLWLRPPANLLAHRGFTHSILFAVLISVLLALAAERVHRPHNIKMVKWVLFFLVQVFIHIFIDAFNNYGVGWFEPFSHYRVSFNAIYVADPFFSVWPAIGAMALLVLNTRSPKRQFWWKLGTIISFLYLGYCLVNKTAINNSVTCSLQKQHIAYTRYFTTPAPLQNWLWYVVASSDSGYYVGYRSVFDGKQTAFTWFSRNTKLLNTVHNSEELAQLIRFSQGFYTIEKWNDTLVFNDLRFGQVTGWQNPHEKFAFHYYLGQPASNTMVVQRGRFAKWDWGVFKSLVKRAGGN